MVLTLSSFNLNQIGVIQRRGTRLPSSRCLKIAVKKSGFGKIGNILLRSTTIEKQLTHIDLFAGIGGFTLAAEWAGFKTVVFCEKEKFCQKVLKKHWPETPIIPEIAYEILKNIAWIEKQNNS